MATRATWRAESFLPILSRAMSTVTQSSHVVSKALSAPQPLHAVTRCYSQGRVSLRIPILPVTSLYPISVPSPRGCLILMSPGCSWPGAPAPQSVHDRGRVRFRGAPPQEL